jgi:hypothetical protein
MSSTLGASRSTPMAAGLRATHRIIIAKTTRRFRNRGHVLRWHREPEGRIISHEVFAPHGAGRAVA